MNQMKIKNPAYQRTTELRHVSDNNIYELIRMLDENDCWRELMEIIPKRFDAIASSAPGALKYDEIISAHGYKYTSSDIRLIEKTCSDSSAYEYHSAILLEEWKTSGKRNERPTLGVLLQLLVQADLYRAADFVAEKLLNEPKPVRPANGPAAVVTIDLDELADFNSNSYFIHEQSTNILNDACNNNFCCEFEEKRALKTSPYCEKGDASLRICGNFNKHCSINSFNLPKVTRKNRGNFCKLS